jgi:hypothetical protein
MNYENYQNFMTNDPRGTFMYNEGYRVMADPVEYPPPTQNHSNNSHNLQAPGKPHSIGSFMTQNWYRCVLNERFTVGNLRSICKSLDIRASYSSAKKSVVVDIIVNYLNELVVKGKAAEYNRVIEICNQNKRAYGGSIIIPFRPYESLLDGSAFVKLTEMIFDGNPEFPVLRPVKITKRLTPLICLDFCPHESDTYFELEFNYKPPSNYFNFYNPPSSNSKDPKPVRAYLLVYRLKERRSIDAFETFKISNEEVINEMVTPSTEQMIKFSGIPPDSVHRYKNPTPPVKNPSKAPHTQQYTPPSSQSVTSNQNEIIEAKIFDALKDPIFFEMFAQKFKNQQSLSNNFVNTSSSLGMEEIERRIFEVLKKVDPSLIVNSQNNDSTDNSDKTPPRRKPDLQSISNSLPPIQPNPTDDINSLELPPINDSLFHNPFESAFFPNKPSDVQNLPDSSRLNTLEALFSSIAVLSNPTNKSGPEKETLNNSDCGEKPKLNFTDVPTQKIKLVHTDFKLTMAKRLRFNLNNDKLYILGTGRSSVCPISQHQFTKDGTRNRLIIEGAKYGDQHYFIQIVEGEIDEAAFLKEFSFPVVNADIVRKSFFKRDKNENEIESLDIVLPLKCPITMTRLVVPVRGSSCQHLNCCNIDSIRPFIGGKKLFKCPTCSKEMSMGNLVIDGYVQDIINRTKPDDEEVVINAKTGDWNIRETTGHPIDDESEDYENHIFERAFKAARTEGPIESLIVRDILNSNKTARGPPGSSIVNAIVLD